MRLDCATSGPGNLPPPISATLHDDPVGVTGGGPMGRELKNMRIASLIILSGLFVQVAHAAAEIRLSTFPNVMLGTWAETTQQCAAKDKSNVVIELAKYGDGDGICAVSWIDQSEGSRGNEVRALCTSASLPEKNQTALSSCERLAQIARRWDEFICILPEASSTI